MSDYPDSYDERSVEDAGPAAVLRMHVQMARDNAAGRRARAAVLRKKAENAEARAKEFDEIADRYEAAASAV